ncbi:aquaporin [Nakamurella sp. PAMC28650]|uniref:aquaporin n=1 Tax=Nakamurella sp. PAMC28650 TaxID=2762325 RepID=UPI00351BA1E7
MPSLIRRSIAELIGTAILVFSAVGSAVFGIDKITATGVALAFGLTLLVLAYAIGPLSGCRVNPAVTLGVLLSKGMKPMEAAYYWISQILGGIIGAALIHLVLKVGRSRTRPAAAAPTIGAAPTALPMPAAL